MTSFPDPDRDGGYIFRAVNSNGKVVEFGISPGGSPAGFIKLPPGSAGFSVVNAQGSQLFTVPPSGYVGPPAAMNVVNIHSVPGLPDPQVHTIPDSATHVVAFNDEQNMDFILPLADVPRQVYIGVRDGPTFVYNVIIYPQPGDTIHNLTSGISTSPGITYYLWTAGDGYWFGNSFDSQK